MNGLHEVFMPPALYMSPPPVGPLYLRCSLVLEQEVDQLCEDYAKRHTGQSRYNTRNYDLVISMADKTAEEAVDLILKYIG